MSRNESSAQKNWKRYFVFFVLGMLVGGAAIVFWTGHQLEELMSLNKTLVVENERLASEVQNLKQTQKASKKRQDPIVEEIRVIVLDPKPHAIIEAQVIRRLEKDLNALKGKKTEQIGELHPLIHELLRRREYVIERNMAEVRLKTVVISRVLQLYVTVTVKPGEVGTSK